jgi:iron complex transport system substrate-binding protein
MRSTLLTKTVALRASLPRAAWLLAALLALVALLATAGPLHAEPLVVTDDRGRRVELPTPPQRIVSLLPSLTETVCALGACDRLVGVDSYSNWPEQVKGLPRLGGVEDANIERIVALKPDLVLMGYTSRAVARLEGLGIRVVGLDVKALGDVQRVLTTVGQALGVNGAAAAWVRIEAGIQAAADTVPPARRGTSVYFEIGSDGYAASASSHIGELLSRLGARNVVPGHLGTVPKLNPEFVVRADPQLIMVSARSAPTLNARPGWAGMAAVRDRRICAFDAAQNDLMMRPGPRLAEAAQVMALCLRSLP